jgi:hypothetical protein
MLTQPPRTDEHEESGELFWRCPVSNRFGFARPALSNGTITVIAARSGQPARLTSALAYELVAFMSLWVSQTDPAILAGLLAVPDVIPCRPHALLRVAAGSWRGPARSQPQP